ncbi:MAG: DNA repair ATPase [Verrucomicrobiota bacterium]
MADQPTEPPKPAQEPQVQLEGGTYEVIRKRLDASGAELRARLAQLNAARQEVFGSIPTALVATEHITTNNNCVPRDMVSVGQGRFLFGYNVFIGLKTETQLADVFAVYEHKDHTFTQLPLDLISDETFLNDFRQLYKYYKNTFFAKLMVIGPHLFMKFRVGQSVDDFKTFKWLMKDGELLYQGNRSDHELKYPPQHEFEWIRTHRELHRHGLHPHISIADRVFVETIQGDLTIKVEDNTKSGEGIYSEPVEHKDQTLDDAEIFYAIVGNLILLKIRPYQEPNFRYFVFNEKLKEVRRIDALADSCVLLPDDQGIIFSSGYYLQLGEFKQFPTELSNMTYERRITSPNGEDFLYVFYNKPSGTYVLMPYNLIAQKVESPIVCNGFSLFENGEMAFFKATDEPQKHHSIQIWQTPFLDHNVSLPTRKDSFLYKIGNPSIVGCMAECQSLLTLLGKQDTFAGLYVDIVKVTTTIIDSYFWLDNKEAFDLKSTLLAIKTAASSAIDEFEKVIRIRRNTQAEVKRVTETATRLTTGIDYSALQEIGHFVTQLAGLRAVRGEIISLKELRYVDLPAVEALEKNVAEHTEQLSKLCVEFLLKPEALEPYQKKVKEHENAVGALAKVTEAKALDEAIANTGKELEMLIEIVSNLKIEDSTQTTRIIDGISAIYAPLNQIKAALKRRRQELAKGEGEAQFSSQMRLLDQSVTNYLEICDSPERCDEYLTKVMVHVEELEARFADFDEFVLQLTEKREELYTAFENRKLGLVEARNKKATALMASADRILKGIKNRIDGMQSINEINGYFASDLMVEKVRNVVQQLIDLKDTVKSGDIQSRLKTIREDAVRQLKDRQELFVDGKNIIQLGQHKFTVNTQPLELTTVLRDGEMYYHLTGTNFFEKIADQELDATRPAWNQEVVSETDTVYRAEYLAYRILKALDARELDRNLADVTALDDAALLAFVQEFMAPRYSEGYIKGIHDLDGAKILRELLRLHSTIGLLRYHTHARACAAAFWHEHERKDPILAAKLAGMRVRRELFPTHRAEAAHIRELEQLIRDFCAQTGLFPVDLADEAAEYLFHDLTSNATLVISRKAADICHAFTLFLRTKHVTKRFEEAKHALESNVRATCHLIRDWVSAFLPTAESPLDAEYLDEAMAVLLRGTPDPRAVVDAEVATQIAGMMGSHPALKDQTCSLNYNAFMHKLTRHERDVMPLFEKYHRHKAALVEAMRQDMRLDEFRPRVLTSFVRNRLIDSVYLPMVGSNLAKQLGVAGEATRTDRMGMLLLVSPPGYGKTTLMEYIANRLGIIFMKINGPAIGHEVTSLDPGEAPNASAREEIEKLNLAFEMGDNVMICLDDIQHLNPEFLQKFISLCDAQRKIEGVYKGRAKTYDLRGKKVCVVMAGNPYTESGEKFKIPDMLANRADTYNLGDIVGGADEAFKLSYLENTLTSNPVLNRLSSRSQKDVYAIVKIAETGTRDGVEFEGNYSAEETTEMVAVMKWLFRIRDTVLRVNLEYIRSAAQAEAYRTEPPFKLQGSYRNMNRMAEKILPVMNEEEVKLVIADHYKNESQTLTTGAEANLLKFRELQGWMTESDAARWEDIKKTFKRNLLFQGVNQKDPIGQVVAQLSTFAEGLDSIRSVLTDAVKAQRDSVRKPTTDSVEQITGQLAAFAQGLESIKGVLAEGVKQQETPRKAAPAPALDKELVGQLASQLGHFGQTLASIQAALAENVKLQREQPTLRVLDSGEQSDYQITSVSRDTLKKIWEIIQAEREWQAKAKAVKGGDVNLPPPENY